MTVLNLGCGDDHHDDAVNVDALEDCDPDVVANLEDYPWPWDDDSVSSIRMYHVLEHLESVEDALQECHRILRPGGNVVVKWPVGMNEGADPDHEHSWVWETPEMYCGKRPWDVETGLRVGSRSVDVHTHLSGVAGWLYRAWIAHHKTTQGEGRWLFDLPMTSGEFTVVFVK